MTDDSTADTLDASEPPDATSTDATGESDRSRHAESADPDGSEDDPRALRARLDVLESENERLRREYARSHRSRYRRAATGMGFVGVVALVGAWIVPEQRTVLLVLGGTGLFGAVLTFFLTPERTVPGTVGERAHAATVADRTALVDELGLQDDRIYVPRSASPDPVRLFVPQRANYAIPEPDALRKRLVVIDPPRSRGVTFTPVGALLYEEFESTVVGETADDPAALATQLVDAVVETFELAENATIDSDLEGDRVAVRVSDPLYGHLEDVDHPVVSVFATGLAVGLDRPVSATVRESDRGDGLVVCEWGPPE